MCMIWRISTSGKSRSTMALEVSANVRYSSQGHQQLDKIITHNYILRHRLYQVGSSSAVTLQLLRPLYLTLIPSHCLNQPITPPLHSTCSTSFRNYKTNVKSLRRRRHANPCHCKIFSFLTCVSFLHVRVCLSSSSLPHRLLKHAPPSSAFVSSPDLNPYPAKRTRE